MVTLAVSSQSVIVFDLDDTLVYELDYLKSSYLAIAKSLDIDDYRGLYGKIFSMYRNKQNAFEFLSQRYNKPIEELIAAYRTHVPDKLNLIEGAKDLLLEIKAAGGKIAVITDGRTNTQRNKIKAAGLDSLIDALVISQEIGTEKPAEQNYKAIEDQLPGSTYCYIADNAKKDFVTPNNLGWNTIQLIDSGLNIHSNDALDFTDENYAPKYRIFTFAEISISAS